MWCCSTASVISPMRLASSGAAGAGTTAVATLHPRTPLENQSRAATNSEQRQVTYTARQLVSRHWLHSLVENLGAQVQHIGVYRDEARFVTPNGPQPVIPAPNRRESHSIS